MSLRERNRILWFRAAIYFQLGIVVLTAGLIPHFPGIIDRHEYLLEPFDWIAEKIFELLVAGGVFCPLLVLWSLVLTPFRLFRKYVWGIVTIALLFLQVYAMSLLV